MQVKDKTKTPPPFEDSVFHSYQYPDKKKNRSMTRRQRNGKTRKTMRPLLNFLLLGVLALGNIVALGVLPESYPGYENINIEDADEYLSFGETSYFVDRDNLTITTEILKKDPYVRISDVEIAYKIIINGEEYDEDYMPYMYIPAMGFGQDKTYISNTIDNVTELKNDPDASIEIKPYFPDLASYVDSLKEYMYLDEEEENLSNAELLKKYKKEYVEPHSFEILSDGKENPTHSVTFTIQNIGSSKYLNCQYQILFKKDGKVIYADTDYFSPYHDDDTIGSVTYTPKTNIEDYDEVEVYQIDD